MHEFALGSALFEAVTQELQQQPGSVRVQTVRVVVGDLRQVVPEFLEQAFQALIQHTPVKGAKLIIRRSPIQATCICGWKGVIASPPFWCSVCGSQDLTFLTGTECFLESLEFEVMDVHGN